MQLFINHFSVDRKYFTSLIFDHILPTNKHLKMRKHFQKIFYFKTTGALHMNLGVPRVFLVQLDKMECLINITPITGEHKVLKCCRTYLTKRIVKGDCCP